MQMTHFSPMNNEQQLVTEGSIQFHKLENHMIVLLLPLLFTLTFMCIKYTHILMRLHTIVAFFLSDLK